MADRSRIRGFLREEHVTYASILLYITLSSGQIFFNKVLSQISHSYVIGSMFSICSLFAQDLILLDLVDISRF